VRAFYVDGLLDPLRLNRNTLQEARIDLGSRGYAGQYEQRPTVEGGNIVKEEWFQHISRVEFNVMRSREPIHFFLDTAYDKHNKASDNDPSGIIGACIIRNNIYITCAKKVYKTFPELIKFLPDYMAANDFDKNRSTLRIEPKANGISVYQQLREVTNLNVAKIPPPTDDKETRLHGVSPKIECGRVYLVEGDWNEDFIDEVCGFPNKPHDEYVDVLGYAINYLCGEEDDLPANIEEMFY